MRILKSTIALALAASLVIPASGSFAVYGIEEDKSQTNMVTQQEPLTIGSSGQDSYQALTAGNWKSTVTKPTSSVSYPDENNNLYSEMLLAVNTSPLVDMSDIATLPAVGNAQNLLQSAGDQQSETPPDGYSIAGYTSAGTLLEPDHDYSIPSGYSKSLKGNRSAGQTHAVGDRITINDMKDGNTVTVEMVYDGKYCTVWREVGDTKLDDTIAKQIANEYDTKIYSTMSTYFTDQSAIDKNFGLLGIGDGDGKLAIACHDIKDGYQPGGAYTGGFFSSADILDENQPLDLVHIDTYPAMYDIANPSDQSYHPANVYGTFAHELQHMLNFYFYYSYWSLNGYKAEGCPIWLNEGMSEAASSLCGYDDIKERVMVYNISPKIHSGLSFMNWTQTVDSYALSSFFTQYMMAQRGTGIFQRLYTSDLYRDWNSAQEFFEQEFGLKYSKIIENYRIGLATQNSLGKEYNLGKNVVGIKSYNCPIDTLPLEGGGAVTRGRMQRAYSVDSPEYVKYIGLFTGAEYTITAKVSNGTTESAVQEIKAPAGSKVVLTPEVNAGQKVTSYTTSFDSDVNKPTKTNNEISFVMPPRNVTVTANVGDPENHTVTYTVEHLTMKTPEGQDAPATVLDATDLSLVVTAEEGYKCPESIQVMMKDVNSDAMVEVPSAQDETNPEASYYTYAASETEPEKFELTIHNVTGEVAIIASGVEIGNHAVTYNLTDLSKNEDAPVSVADGETLTFTLTPAEGFTLPETIEVLMGETQVTEFDYSKETGVVSIANVTGEITINATGIAVGQHQVTYVLNNLTTNADAPVSVEEGQTLTFTLIAEDGYTLPETITVTMGDVVRTDFTYDQTSGVVTVENVTAPIIVAADGVSTIVPPTDYTVTYNLENLTVNGPTTIAEGETLTATLQPVTDYVLPSTVTVTMNGSDVDYNYNPETGVVTVANVTGDVVIEAAAVEESGYKITYSLQNIYTNGAPSRVEEGTELSVTLIARTGYSLPEAITVTMGGVVLADTDYTYDQATGDVVISAVNGAVTIQASGVRNYTPNPNPDNSGSGGGIIINGDTSGSSGSSSSSDSSSSSSSSKPYTEKESKFKSITELGLGTFNDRASSNVDTKGVVKSTNVVNAVSASNKDVSVKNAKTVASSTLKKMAAKNPDARLVAETTKNGKTVAKLILNASDYKNYKSSLSLGAEVNNKSLKLRLVKAFSNNVQSISLSQSGSFGAEVEVAAKITTTSLDKNNLKFYTYDSDKNTYKEIDVGNYTFDSQGMVHFKTSVGGDILISNGELKKK